MDLGLVWGLPKGCLVCEAKIQIFMAKHLEIGKRGEQLALQFLLSKGFRILETNWRYKRLEVDIIAMDGSVLVFVEVKTRTNDFFGKPEEFVDAKKEKLLAQAAAAYMLKINHEWSLRFDVVSVLLRSEGKIEIQHLPDAFFPGLSQQL